MDVNAKNNIGDTPLDFFAACGNCQSEDDDVFELFIDHGLDANAIHDIHKDTLLHRTLTDPGQYGISELLIPCTEINIKNSYGQTLLHTAAEVGDDYNCELLIEHGADVNAKNKRGETPLI